MSTGGFLPKGVQFDLAEADRIEQQLRQQLQGGIPQSQEGNQPSLEAAAPQAGQQAQGEQATQTASLPPDQQQLQSPGTPDADSQQAQQTAPEFDQSREDQRQKNWEQMYRVIEGKYRKEVPQLQEALRQREQETALLRQDVLSFKDQLSQLQQQVQQKPADQPVQQPTDTGLDVEKLGDEYPEEMVKLFKTVEQQNAQMRQMQQTIDQQNQRLQTTQQQVSRVNQDQAQTREQQFHAALSQFCPEWSQIDQDPAFATWLDGVDENTGYQRRALATPHYQALNAPAVARYYNAFKSQFYGAQSTASTQHRQQPVQQSYAQTQTNNGPVAQRQQMTAQDVLALQLEPDRAGGETKPMVNKKTWSKQEVDQFEKDVRNGAYRGRDVERRAIENDIYGLAAIEGRLAFNPIMPGISMQDVAKLNR